MPQRDADVVVVGSGPNGLVAACVLARQGVRVRVLDANPRRPGGAVRSEALTLPGFVHDVGATFSPFARTSPALAELNLGALEVEWLNADVESSHPASDVRMLGRHAPGPGRARHVWLQRRTNRGSRCRMSRFGSRPGPEAAPLVATACLDVQHLPEAA